MTKTITALFFTFVLCVFAYANDYDDAWTAIRSKNFSEAKALLVKLTKDPTYATEAYMTLLYLQTYQGKEQEIPGFYDQFTKIEGKDAYIYASWFNASILGQYSKKKDYQLNFLNKIISDNSFNGSLQAAAHYVKAMHHIFSHEYTKARQEYDLAGAIQDWQLAGPFENLSGSGFNVNHGPLNHAEANAKFTGLHNIETGWFTPLRMNREAWTFTYPHIPENSSIVYAQAFVNSPEDMNVFINVGCNGSLKVWVNDGLVLAESKERVTELDYYKNQCSLKKGYNRILIQLGYTDNSMPNFIVRVTDNNFSAIKGLTVSTQYQSYTKAAGASRVQSIKHFSEEFFEKKILAQPANLVNYILLSQAYLRDQRVTEARQTIEQALKLSPENPLLKFELIQCLIKANNRTLLLQEVEWLKENDPQSYLNFQLQIQNLLSEEKYREALQELDKMVAIYEEDDNAINTRLNILAKMEKIEDMLKLIEKGYSQYPENTQFVSMKFNVEKMLMKNSKSAVKVYEKYLKDNYNYNVLTALADEYKSQGMNDRYLDILEEIYKHFGSDPGFVSSLSKYYFEKGDYKKSLEYAKEMLLLAPYTGKYWENLAIIYEAMGNANDAIKAYEKAIYYDRTDYDARKKLSAIQNQLDLYKLLPETDVYAVIRQAPANKEYDYNYLLDEKGVLIYDEGASEEYVAYVVKINTQKGIDSWKEIYLPYASTQSLLVEKIEVVKSNGSKLSAERDEDHVVFTGLEPGDAIYVKYRLQNYSSGRLGSQFYDKFVFNAFVPSQLARYTFIAPKDFKFNSKMINSEMQPVLTEKEGLQIYTWEIKNAPALKSEPLMPPLNDVGTVLHISTVKSWNDVAQWYSDLTYQDLTDNIELENVYAEIFPDKKTMTNLEKAKRIYEYILTNIRYSSVSFRQSGLIPQSVSTTISTRLGDCKDLSSLFVALATKAGISAQLVLIDTRDNGAKDIILPSLSFNHCISLAKIDGNDYYIELTDSHLPFGSLNYNLLGALSLVVPPHGQKSNSELRPLPAITRTKDKIARVINVSVAGKDIRLDVVTKRYGALVSGWREDYATLPPDKQKEEFEQTISNGYKNPVKLESLSFTGLDNLEDSMTMRYSYNVKNEVAEAGSMKMVKVPFIDLVATLENISAEERKFPIEYWNYETSDGYETTVTIQLPAGQKFIEIPSNQNFSFKGNSYSLKYVMEGEKLRVSRIAKLKRENIEPADYAAFKKFFNDIVEAESKYLVFK